MEQRQRADEGAVGTPLVSRPLVALLVIMLLGLLSAVLYYGALVRPYALARYGTIPLRDLGKIGGYDVAAGIRYIVPLLLLWGTYLGGARLRRMGAAPACSIATGLWRHPRTLRNTPLALPHYCGGHL